jgi:hypothetical protein
MISWIWVFPAFIIGVIFGILLMILAMVNRD